MKYRPEIDGLRAIAVLPVILFHAGSGLFGGGFVGVDVFFVISGYLITTILIDDLARGQFSIARFYERRARRILPALFLVMAACYPFAWAWMFTSDFKTFAESSGIVVLALSNFYFIGQGNYFAPDSDLQPLLHTWSLGVEEQYYFLFPAFLFLLWKYGRRHALWLIVLGVLASFALSEWGSRAYPAQNFYFTFSRLWEIGVGSALAFVLRGRERRGHDGLALAGLGLIGYAVFAYDRSTPFPSAYALAPVLGTALVIAFAGPRGWVTRLLSAAPLVGLGLISYSAYLWHQPLFAFARIRSATEPSSLLMMGLVVVSLGLAWATWAWVETPFRKTGRGPLPTRRGVFVVAGAISTGFFALGLAVSMGNGFAWRLSPQVQRIAAVSEERLPAACTINSNDPLPSQPIAACLHPVTPGGTIDVALLGDSHATAIAPTLERAMRVAGLGTYSVNFPTCLPLTGFHFVGRYQEVQCDSYNRAVYDYLRRSGVGTIVLTARWEWYLRGVSFDNGEGGEEGGASIALDLLDHAASSATDPARRARVLQGFEARIRELARRFNVVLVYPIPEAGWNVPLTVAKRVTFGDGRAELTTSYAVYRQRTHEVNALFDRLAAELPNVYPARVFRAMCSEQTGRCLNASAGQVYYRDDDHLSRAGAERIAPVITAAVEAAVSERRANR